MFGIDILRFSGRRDKQKIDRSIRIGNAMGAAPPKTITREAVYDAAKAVSNWGRWGSDDQIGASTTSARKTSWPPAA